jgi:tetratricopeptide (TPR) repeat protein
MVFMRLALVCFLALAAAQPCWADAMDDANDGVKAQESGDLERALSLYTRVIDSGEFEIGDNVLAWVLHNRGIIYMQRNELDRAIQDYNKGVEVHPDPMLYFNRGRAMSAKGDDAAAIEDYTRCLEMHPDFLRAYQMRGLAYMNKGEVAKAKADLAKAKIYNSNLKY